MQFSKEHVITCILSVALSLGVMFTWDLTHPAARFVKVDVDTIINVGKSALEKQMTPQMTADDQKAMLEKIRKYSVSLDNSLGKIANNCKCAILNANALVRLPSGGMANIEDMTETVQDSAMAAMATK